MFGLRLRATIVGALICVMMALSTPASAQNETGTPALPQGEISIATRVVPPFVMRGEDDELHGFSIELWRAIVHETGLKSHFRVYDTLPRLLDAVRTREDSAGISAISVTSERSKSLDFSQPMFRSGMSIMVRGDQGMNVLSIMFSGQMLQVLLVFLLVLVVPAHVIWFLARGRDDGLPISENYIPGIIDAIFWCAESMGGAAQAHPTRVFARVAAIIWVYIGIVLIAYFTAFATTSLTLQSLRHDISGPKDLAGKRVAVVEGSTSAKYTASLKAQTAAHPNFEAAATALLDGKADALVFDTPVILYYARNEPRVQVAGAQFKPESYGIVFPPNSPLRQPVNQALLRLVENGTYEDLYRKWFGAD